MSGNTLGIHFSFIISNFSLLITHFSFERSDLSGGYCGGVPPLPIPNREVKPACADGTAMQCGRVGGRHFFSESCRTQVLRLSFYLNTETQRYIKCRFVAGKVPFCRW